MQRSRLVLAVCVSVLVAGLVGAPAAGAAGDTTPPVLVVPAHATFVVGSQVSDTAGGADRESAYYPGSLLQQRISWTGTDRGSGICGYDVFAVPAGDDPYALVTNATQASFTGVTTDYDDQQGGGSFKVRGWDVTARDCAGNTTTRFVQASPVVTQEDGWTYGYSGVSVAYSGTWKTSTCSCWSGDQVRRTTQAGASVTLSRIWAAQETLGLVMEKAPDRGRFQVYVDGALRATVDTFASTAKHRVVVWKLRLPAGAHQVTLVNLGTSGRPRIDLDAVLTG